MLLEKNEINAIASCIALIEQYTKPHLLSVSVTLATIMLLIYLAIVNMLSGFWFIVLTLIILIGVLVMVYTIRIGFDLTLLRQLEKQENNIDAGLMALDHSLTKLKLIPASKAGRNLNTRLQGCLGLFKTQVGLCVLQIIAVLGSVVIHLYLSESIIM